MKKRLLTLIAAITMLLSLSACGETTVPEPQPEISYKLNSAYIGNQFYSASDNVEGLVHYYDFNEYLQSGKDFDSVIAEYGAAEKEELLSACENVLVIAPDNNKNDIIKEFTGADSIETTENEDFSLLGVLFTKISEKNEFDAVGIYTMGKVSKGTAELTDYEAYCVSYEYKKHYQGDNFVTTEVYNMQKASDIFNVFDFEGKAYSVSMLTFVDYLDNPTVSASHYLFEHSLAYFTDIKPVSSTAGDLTSLITVNNDGWEIKMAPNSDVVFAENEEMPRNFYFYRQFLVSDEHNFSGKVIANDKGSMLDRLSWTITDTNSADETEYTYLYKNLTVAADMVNEHGHYAPTTKTTAVIGNGTDNKEYSYTIGCDVWAIVWGDDHE